MRVVKEGKQAVVLIGMMADDDVVLRSTKSNGHDREGSLTVAPVFAVHDGEDVLNSLRRAQLNVIDRMGKTINC